MCNNNGNCMILDSILLAVVTAWLFNRYSWKKYPSATAITVLGFNLHVYCSAIYIYYWYGFNGWELSDKFNIAVNLIRTGAIALLSSCIVANRMFPRREIASKRVQMEGNAYEHLSLNIFTLFSLFIGILYLASMPSIPILNLFADSSLLEVSREQATTASHVFNIASNFIYGFIPILAIYYYFKNCKSIFYLLIVSSYVLSLSTGQKSPLVYITFLVLLAISLKQRDFPYKRYFSIVLVLFCLLFAFVFYENRHLFYALDDAALQMVFDGLMFRIMGGARTLITYAEFFPDYMPFCFMTSTDVPIDQLVFQFMRPDSPVIGSANAVFIGNLYANFGNYLIIALISFVLFLCVFCIDNYWFNRMKSPLEFAFYVFFSVSCLKFATTDYRTAFTNFYYPILSLYGYTLLFCSIKTYGRISVRSFNKPVIVLSILTFLYVLQGQLKGFILSR